MNSRLVLALVVSMLSITRAASAQIALVETRDDGTSATREITLGRSLGPRTRNGQLRRAHDATGERQTCLVGSDGELRCLHLDVPSAYGARAMLIAGALLVPLGIGTARFGRTFHICAGFEDHDGYAYCDAPDPIGGLIAAGTLGALLGTFLVGLGAQRLVRYKHGRRLLERTTFAIMPARRGHGDDRGGRFSVGLRF
jgi:hypothetical protein